jgi:hypothetical protein
MSCTTLAYLQLYQRLGLTPVRPKPCSKEPLLRWGDGWNPIFEQLHTWASQPNINWGVHRGENIAVLDFDSPEAFNTFRRDRLEIAPTKNLRYQVVRNFS